MFTSPEKSSSTNQNADEVVLRERPDRVEGLPCSRHGGVKQCEIEARHRPCGTDFTWSRRTIWPNARNLGSRRAIECAPIAAQLRRNPQARAWCPCGNRPWTRRGRRRLAFEARDDDIDARSVGRRKPPARLFGVAEFTPPHARVASRWISTACSRARFRWPLPRGPQFSPAVEALMGRQETRDRAFTRYLRIWGRLGRRCVSIRQMPGSGTEVLSFCRQGPTISVWGGRSWPSVFSTARSRRWARLFLVEPK